MKTIHYNYNRAMSSMGNLRMHPIHNYGGKETLTGRVCGNRIRDFWRKDGSCQCVFDVFVGGERKFRTLELYLENEAEWEKAQQLLQDGQELKIDYCRRSDQYINPRGIKVERKFLFIGGVDGLRPLKAA